MSPKPNERFKRGWSFLVDEFFKKPLRMAVVAVVSGVLITGGNFVVKKTTTWFSKVIVMNKRMERVEDALLFQARADSALIQELKEQRGILDTLRYQMAGVKGALSAEGIYLSRINVPTSAVGGGAPTERVVRPDTSYHRRRPR